MSVHAFVDETKYNGLLVVAAVLAPRDLAPDRTTMRGLCLPGQSRLHFTKERPSRRREIAAEICRTGVALNIYDATSIRDQRQARAGCLRQIVVDLAAARASLTYEHLPARSEPLLWIADAAAWCWTHGAAWQERLAPVVSDIKRI